MDNKKINEVKPIMPDSKTIDHHAREEISKLKPRVNDIEVRTTDVEKWQSTKDDDLKKIKNWFIGAVFMLGVQTFGLWEMLKGLIF